MLNKLFGGSFILIGAAVIARVVVMHHDYIEYIKLMLTRYPGFHRFATNVGMGIGLATLCVITGVVLMNMKEKKS